MSRFSSRLRPVGIALAVGLIAATAAPACSGCDNEDELAGIYAYLDMFGMNPSELAAAKQRAYDSYMEKKMAAAKASFVARFKLYAAPPITAEPAREAIATR